MTGNPWTRRLAWLGGLCGLLVALLLFAPARWVTDAITEGTGGQLQLVNARGTVWSGQADLLLTGGDGSRSQTALPQGLDWRLAPTWQAGPAMALRLRAPCCTPQPVAFTLLPQLGGATLAVAAFDSRWPAELLSGLGTPWNTLRLEGALALRSDGLSLQWASGRLLLRGGVGIDALDLASRLSSLRPLGSYRATLQGADDGSTAQLDLQTLRGELLLQGSGQWVGGRLRFAGDAQAAPGSEPALNNLLNIMGRRTGARSVITIG